MATSVADPTAPAQGVTLEVALAGLAFAASVALMAPVANASQEPPGLALLVSWPLFALAGAVLLDRTPGVPVGRVLVGLALVPAPLMLLAAVRAGGRPDSTQLLDALQQLAGSVAVLLAVALPLSLRRGRATRGTLLSSGAAAAAGCAVAFRPALWPVALTACGVVWLQVVRATRAADRLERRRVVWLLVALAVAGAITATAWLSFSTAVAAYVVAAALATLAWAVARVALAQDFRPLTEPLLDLAAVLAALGAAATLGLLVRVGAGWASLPSPSTSAWFGAVVTLATALPAAVWVRRNALSKKYGSGILTPADVAAITADLHAHTEPRALLGKAARMVAAASGSREARIVLGPDDPAAPAHWVRHALVVGGDTVGVLLVEPADPEGPELRQRKVVDQLVPTVALVTRAVGLAIETEHARRDAARERDAERARILGDLHDGLGPALAGMSMRVQAALRRSTSPEESALLTDLAAGLATSRTDLRRVVAGLTPAALHDGQLAPALHRLVGSFQGAAQRPSVALHVDLAAELTSEVQVAVYRCVAEGITNALRHAHASAIDITVTTSPDRVQVQVRDDGAGGPVVPGVGLTSLQQRAESLGGRLAVSSTTALGTVLDVELPVAPR